MTAEDFRHAALALAGATEGVHSQRPDFRVAGRVFASLGHPDATWAVVRLGIEAQREFVTLAPRTFVVLDAAWGANGATWIRLPVADVRLVEEALASAWRGERLV